LYLNPVDTTVKLNFRWYRAVNALFLCCENHVLMLYREISTDYSELHIKHTDFFCMQYVEFLNDTLGGSGETTGS